MMYAKIFRSIYDGSIANDWQLRLVFMDLLILADREGVVDMTHESIARTTGVPLDIVREGIEKLEQPDGRSRRPDLDGKRIERLDSHRNWGWRIVNYTYYRNLCNLEQKREIDRQRLAKKRADEKEKKTTKSNTVGGVSHFVANVAQLEGEGELDTKRIKTYVPKYPQKFLEIWDVYPRKIGKEAALSVWKTRVKQGATHVDLMRAAYHYAEWAKDKSKEYVKHATTFFGPKNHWKDWVEGPPEGCGDGYGWIREGLETSGSEV